MQRCSCGCCSLTQVRRPTFPEKDNNIFFVLFKGSMTPNAKRLYSLGDLFLSTFLCYQLQVDNNILRLHMPSLLFSLGDLFPTVLSYQPQ